MHQWFIRSVHFDISSSACPKIHPNRSVRVLIPILPSAQCMINTRARWLRILRTNTDESSGFRNQHNVITSVYVRCVVYQAISYAREYTHTHKKPSPNWYFICILSPEIHLNVISGISATFESMFLYATVYISVISGGGGSGADDDRKNGAHERHGHPTIQIRKWAKKYDKLHCSTLCMLAIDVNLNSNSILNKTSWRELGVFFPKMEAIQQFIWN